MSRSSSFWVLLFCYNIMRVSPQCQIAQVCITDYNKSDCAGIEELVPNSIVEGCCPSCTIGGGTPTTQGCNPSVSTCLPDGRYAPVQCKGDRFTGRCFCSDPNGRRIFGQMWRDQAEHMTCACSRRRAEMEAEGKVVTLHCSANGDYEQLQCDSGMCWCVQPRNGQPIVTPVHEEDMERLPCYSAAVIGERYLRKCESLTAANGFIRYEQSTHGTNFLGSPVSTCDYDGSYGPIQILNGIAYCTGRDGKILGAWQTTVATMQGMNCNCARDTMIFFPERGMTVTETCEANGNYRALQSVGSVYYCVDTDGYHTELHDEIPPGNCQSYAAT
ncbi:thyroglobulin-like [Spodoptera litura]|uniref:Thyroglobulin-like n=1 Tax=Spodoptera litura TaxID=69820 RepID=A0A9J7EG81_SPOLT|nr:thyroglobulin-like [Spodoptera litura]